MTENEDIFAQFDSGDKTTLRPTPGGAASDRTILKPNPGGRRTPTPQAPPAYASPPVTAPVLPNVLDKTDNNPIIAVAKPLLSLLTRLSQTHQHNDVNGLHQRTVQEIRNFENLAQQKSIDAQQITIARYILCAAIDEMVLNTPWGSNSSWPNQSLLITFHRETTGGQKFFTLLERLQQNPGVNINLLELIASCLALGYQGKFRVIQNGVAHIETIRVQLHQQIAMVRGEYEHSLSPHCTAINVKRSSSRSFPVWVIGAITGAIIVSAYIGFSISLNNDAKPVLEKIQQINPIETEQVIES